MKNKLAIINSGFIGNYIKYLAEICDKNGVQLDIFENIQDFSEYDFVITEWRHFHENACFVQHAHSLSYRVRNSNLLYKFIYFISHWRKIAYKKQKFLSASKIFAVSNVLKNDLVKNYGVPSDKINVVYPGITVTEHSNFDTKLATRKPFIVAMSGMGFVSKGGYIMLDAVRIFKKLYPDIKIKVNIIYPKYKKNLGVRAYVKLFGLDKDVEFFGRQEDMASYYENCHVFVCPSISEAFGRVVVEAMNAGRPVIIGSNVGAVDIIQDGVNGFVYEADKKASYNLAVKIKEVYDRYDSLEPLIERAYGQSKIFTWENFAKGIFETLYDIKN